MISATEYSFEEMCSTRVNRAKGKCLGPNEVSFTFFLCHPKVFMLFLSDELGWAGIFGAR